MQTIAAAPAYSFDRRKTGPQRRNRPGKLCWAMVKDIRRFAQQEGFTLSKMEQARVMQKSYPISTDALLAILRNEAYYDPTYTPQKPDTEFWGQRTLAQVLVVVASRI